ncbi:hypothetical protein acsn021_07000 [Anaerocolumna cellulosilytica]|uniref:Uncharacterized protein n=1 Tax=Anaerocolumna cellulosilytica TaxID=433286 RepID=A0A6S6R1P2_9FIRM|nr:hypothetical protein [Anaerocolumna cellulosilytica]MBB5197983.1 hypothetical protein [Anaerocolumna cellulosilytica]BCJ93131.1 hypothetical protein acsn021_07000 [Anaerocolumna cellulosilytica]
MKKVLSLALVLVLVFSLSACSKTSSGSSDLKFGQVEYAAHGTKSFAVTSVVLQGDKIAVAYIDEFQVLPKEGTTGVPNSDSDFGANFADAAQQLASKRVNDAYYSAMMSEKAGATVTIVNNFEAIESFAEGKTITELEAAINGKTSEEILDAVSGATLVDTSGYIQSIIEAAKAAK